MKCPVDESMLVMSERNGIEIDFCPQCRGVWLDRGELDKIVERAAENQPRVAQRGGSQYGDYDRGGHGSGYSDGHHNRKRKGGWLGELFD